MKVLIIGDAPYVNTGFGKVNGIAAQALIDAGHEVACVAGLVLEEEPRPETPYQVFLRREGDDLMGTRTVSEVIYEWEPDVVYHTGEPGTLTAFSQVTPARIPVVAYVPIEGEPITNPDWHGVLKAAKVFTTSSYGAQIVKRDVGVDIDWVYHGVDREVFRVNGRRSKIRQMFGWDDKFVIMTVAANVRRKQHPRLLEAVSLLKHLYKQNDVILYEHTIPFNGYWLEGWNLPQLSYQMGIYENVVFNPAMTKWNASVPEVGQFDNVGLVDLYNAADLFVLPSQVEGFGLPIAEAMACGLPVMVTQYAAGWEVARPAGVGIPVRDWEIHKSGTRYANVDVAAMAKEILRLKRSPRERERRSVLGLQRVRDFTWEAVAEKVVTTIEATKDSWEVPTNQAQEPQDQGQEAVT